jgi:hypothetical protein
VTALDRHTEEARRAARLADEVERELSHVERTISLGVSEVIGAEHPRLVATVDMIARWIWRERVRPDVVRVASVLIERAERRARHGERAERKAAEVERAAYTVGEDWSGEAGGR